MEYIYERKINYYETDRMGIVHHSNYIRFFEEARCNFLDDISLPFSEFEKQGLTIPVLGVNCTYKTPVTFNDIILVKVQFKEITGVKMTVSYEVINKETNNVVVVAETKHCFTNTSLKPINIKKSYPEIYDTLTKYI